MSTTPLQNRRTATPFLVSQSEPSLYGSLPLLQAKRALYDAANPTEESERGLFECLVACKVVADEPDGKLNVTPLEKALKKASDLFNKTTGPSDVGEAYGNALLDLNQGALRAPPTVHWFACLDRERHFSAWRTTTQPSISSAPPNRP